MVERLNVAGSCRYLKVGRNSSTFDEFVACLIFLFLVEHVLIIGQQRLADCLRRLKNLHARPFVACNRLLLT